MIILITLPHRRTETSDLVTDMGGRTATVEVNPWNTEDLATIATLGFGKLNLVDGTQVADRVAGATVHRVPNPGSLPTIGLP